MRFTSGGVHALRALAHLARHEGSGFVPAGAVAAAEGGADPAEDPQEVVAMARRRPPTIWGVCMGQQFARVRRSKGLTQAELAKRASVRLRSLQGWEQGARIPRFDRVVQLADALGVSLNELAGWKVCKGKGH
jgi:DNA-binding XRE family transcriptional regulator